MTTPAEKPLKIFCSYAHEDEAYVGALRTSLRPLERRGLIEWWHDRELIPGQEWREAIDENLQAADIILLLISPDFMASDFAYEEEMQRAIERHERGEASVIPIIVRRTDLEGAPFKHLQSLPKDLRPINTWSDRDEAWLDVVRGIRKAINRLVSERGGREQEIGPTPQQDESAEPVEHARDREIADTVTFLFTSMEDSTSLWQRYRLQMPSVLRRHFEILRSCVEKHRGRVFKTVGDACCAIFDDPVEGLRAALEAQKALLAERWSGKVPVRVSMALHTGPAIEERDGDYVGPPVNLVTRLLSVARGGQVLLSGVVTELVSDDLPYFEPGAELRNLGEQRLKDITRPVRIFQLLAPGFHHVEGLESPDADEERYRIERLLGEGGIARVYLAYEMEFDRTVALKVLREDYAEDSEVIERFGREARSAGRLSGHPHIVTIYARGRGRDGSYYLAMEYVPGGTLKDLIEREGPLPADEAVEIALQVAHALKFAHEHGIIHRDVKPQNVLLTGSGEAKVADFGIARALEATTMTRTGSILGTPQYLSPEQALGQPANPQSDLYALGVVLYEMLTGELPFDAETPIGIAMKHISGELRPPRELNPDVPEQLNDITVKLLAREPEERYSNAGALIEDLQQVSKGFATAAGRILDGSDEASRVETTSETADRERDEQIRRLEGLYAQAHQAYEGQEWQAVVDIFEQIRAEESDYPDPEGLLASAREALEAQELTQKVVAVYAEGQRHMDAWEWQQALECFEEVQRLEPGYRDAETLLLRVRQKLALPPKVEVPDLNGQAVSRARSILADRGLELGARNEVPSETTPEGQIIEQSPEAGAEMEAGSSVSVTISSGLQESDAVTPLGQSRTETIQVPAAPTESSAARKLHREVGMVGLLFVSLGSMIGAGWLFNALYATTIAGPAAIISWVLGALVMLILALVHAELGSMYPVAGGSARYPHFSFGSLAGFVMGWAVWIGAVAVAPLEVLVALVYLTNYFPWLTSTSAGVTVLTPIGIIISVILMALFTAINLLGVGSLAKSNNVIMVWKIAIPFLAILVLITVAFNPANFTSQDGFAPFGIQGVLSAIVTGGIIFAYQGFEQAIQLGAETDNPQRNIPLAIVGSMVIGFVMYIGLQIAFVGALPPTELKNGWANLSFPQDAGPFAGLATLVGAGWLATLIYIDAFISPAGTGLIYAASSSRLSFAFARNHYIPRQFGYLNGRGVPLVSIIFSFLVGCFIFLPFPGWQQLIGFMVSATVIGYAAVPLAFGAMRRQEPDHPRPFKLPAGEVLAPLSFIVANLIIYWSTWDVIWKVLVAMVFGLVLLGIGHIVNPSELTPTLNWRSSSWLWPYFIGLGVLSYLGPEDLAGIGVIPFGVDILIAAAFSIAIYYYAMSVRLTPEEVQRHIADAREEVEEG